MTLSTSGRIVVPGGALRGELRPPPDKSITHRAILLSSLAQGTSRIVHPLTADDCERTAEAFRNLGISIEADSRGEWIVVGHGLYGLQEPRADHLYCGNSGTTLRLIAGVLSGQPFATKLMGDKSLSNRPMARVVEPLQKMGAEITARDGRFAPLRIHGRRPLRAIEWKSPVPSAQVKSCVLLAGLYADGTTTLEEPLRSRDHTERMMAAAGVRLTVEDHRVSILGGQSLTPRDWLVPSDISSAAFFMVAALIAPGSELMLRNVNTNPTRDGILEILEKMGASIHRERDLVVCGEPITDLLVRPSSLKAVSFGAEIMPRLVDEVPILALAATQAQGTTEIRGAAELRVKESDRLAHIAKGLSLMGAQIEELTDGLRITGPTPLRGAVLDSAGDHRLAMTFAIAGLIARGETQIADADCVDISFPTFWRDLESLRVQA
ncbi:MAG: 3-phosphoshikimate 1-carboxyvinyltransferase [Elusimicrobia bacterium]|nr:3-phosphoshikimate 1-carboxyvinyltransferase [Elusimicrobiota bacterium]